MTRHLHEPILLGDLTLANRMVMAPMTRNRADATGNCTPIMALYYQQRASAGLIISESAPISASGIGYPATPGIFNESQALSWKKVTDAVHSSDGLIFAQLQHCGRISHPSLQIDNQIPIAPSAIEPAGMAFTYTGMQPFVTPRELSTSEIPTIVQQFATAAQFAKMAGFDGVEVHGANGYLIDQFLRDGSNIRHDGYGGNASNRMRFLNEVLDAVCGVWANNRVGLRLTPENSFNSMSDSNPAEHFHYFVEQLGPRNLAYLHVLEGDMMSDRKALDYKVLRARYFGTYIANNGYDRQRAQAALSSGAADLVAFGTPFLANPDLVRRYRDNTPLNQADPSTFYGGSELGYTDYAALPVTEHAAS